MQQQIFDFLSFLKHLLLTLQSQIKLHILLLFKFFSLCNQRSMCRLTLTCYVAFVPGNRWKVRISAYKIRLHLSCGFQWRSPWTLASLGNLGNQQHSERQDCFDPSVGRLHHLFPESHFLWGRVHPIHFSTIAFTWQKREALHLETKSSLGKTESFSNYNHQWRQLGRVLTTPVGLGLNRRKELFNHMRCLIMKLSTIGIILITLRVMTSLLVHMECRWESVRYIMEQ